MTATEPCQAETKIAAGHARRFRNGEAQREVMAKRRRKEGRDTQLEPVRLRPRAIDRDPSTPADFIRARGTSCRGLDAVYMAATDQTPSTKQSPCQAAIHTWSECHAEEIVAILREPEADATTAEVCRKRGIGSATFYA